MHIFSKYFGCVVLISATIIVFISSYDALAVEDKKGVKNGDKLTLKQCQELKKKVVNQKSNSKYVDPSVSSNLVDCLHYYDPHTVPPIWYIYDLSFANSLFW